MKRLPRVILAGTVALPICLFLSCGSEADVGGRRPAAPIEVHPGDEEYDNKPERPGPEREEEPDEPRLRVRKGETT